ncbi:MAG: hypothetical protein ACLR23_11960 [Clostridia bacterium]
MTGMEDSRLVSVSGYEEAVRCSAQVRSARQSWAEAKKAVQEIEAKIQISVENQNELDREIRTAGKGIWGNRVLQWTGLACCALFLLLSFIFEKPVLALGALPALILFSSPSEAGVFRRIVRRFGGSGRSRWKRTIMDCPCSRRTRGRWQWSADLTVWPWRRSCAFCWSRLALIP